ncbi:uncharacterized protein FFM5_15334 [Fusarium fujikuroi]|nr:uncharacterized protein FFM5_15334 [Fusarium fujikuroi]
MTESAAKVLRETSVAVPWLDAN